MANQFTPVMDRFEEKFLPEPNSGCWIWTGSASPSRGSSDLRPHLTINGRRKSAYRFSYETFVGDIPKGAMICHRCDVSLCVNPDHLYAGDHKTNAYDAVERGRHPAALHPEIFRALGSTLRVRANAALASAQSVEGE